MTLYQNIMRHRTRLSIYQFLFIVVLLSFLICYISYESLQCDFEDGKTLIETAQGNSIKTFDPDVSVKSFLNLTNVCDFVDGKLQCPDVRHFGETMLRQMQLATVRLMISLDRICRKHGIVYWMWRGGLLGTVRHRGFIPWDNELDIGMMREDYEKFRLVSHELPSNIFLQNASSDPEYGRDKSSIMAKLRDNLGCFGYCAKVGCNFHDGPMIDMFGFEEDEAGIIRETTRNRVRFTVLKEDVFPLKEMNFEGFDVYIPNDFKKILINSYGPNYGEIPPMRSRCPPGGLLGLPWIPCAVLTKMEPHEKKYFLYRSIVSKLKFISWYF